VKVLAALVLALLVPSQVLASSTVTFNGSISSNERFMVNFVTAANGDITASATYPLRQRWYKIWVHDLSGPSECQDFVDNRWGREPDDTVSCTIPGAPVGSYRIEFWSSSGKTSVTVTLTAEL